MSTKSVALREMFGTFAKIGFLSFGGPAAQISLMHRIIVEEKGWLSEKQFLNALSFCMLLPGPEAMQLATYSGWRLHGVIGGLIAGLWFVLPGALIVLALAMIYAFFGNVPLVGALFLGVKAAVLIIVIEALLRVSKRALNGRIYWAIAALAFIGIFFLALPYPLIVFLAALFGFFWKSKTTETDNDEKTVSASFSSTIKTVLVWLLLWWIPVLILGQFSDQPILTEIAAFFSKLAVVTFGGAYAVLAYMGQDVVGSFGWLSAGEMMDGLGLAETTPGPLILVTEFVGFLAAFREGGFLLGMIGAIITLWVTFVPCFLWIFAGAPYIEWISAQPRLSGALSAITAAVVGVILNLSVWFGLHVFFKTVTPQKYGLITLWQPDLTSLDWRVVVLSALCAILLLKFHWNLIQVLLISAGLSWLLAEFA
ncbi:MAG: chromate efflux transporter [Rhizobiaceae bacterium]|nr:chromate efflux transporter [Rhizobiaceae bacterium]